tara:strand:+ start:815 stop:991 length:177 start_codon:yes stop_codon:yes gene_type:complete
MKELKTTTTETITKTITQKQFEQVIEKILDLGWDYDRMSSSGKQVYNEILTILGIKRQ